MSQPAASGALDRGVERVVDALARRLAALPEPERRRWHGVALCVALYLVHATAFSTWFIEDAAISFAFAQHAAAGEGFVAFPGGGWVEGFSNPTWTLLLTLTSLLGGSPWTLAKLLGVGCGALTLPLAYRWARRLGPDEPGLWPVLAPLALACSTQFTLWCASGLENGLFGLLLAAAAVRLLDEGERSAHGVSGALLGLLAITRPEGPMYAGLIAALGGGWALRAGGLRWAAGFLVGGLGVFLGWHGWRYAVFAWEFPNTYYAKQTDARFEPFGWGQRGWAYLRGWALVSVQGFLLPLYTLGQSGLRGRAGLAGIGLTGVLIGTLIPGIDWVRALLPLPTEPALAVHLRVGALCAAAALFPLLGAGRPGTTARWMAWGLTGAALFFAVYTGGDWMKGYRWLSLGAVPLAVLLADGARLVGEALAPLADTVLRRATRPGALALGLVAPTLLSGVGQTLSFLSQLETSPYDVRRRVLYMRGVQERLHLDRASLIEVDMGAHMLWSGFELFDIAGLCDVPIARHHHQRPFIDAYLHDEHRPTFAHLHGGWATRSGITRRPWFNHEYVEIPPYGHRFTAPHVGNHVRRDTFAQPTWTGAPGRRGRFGSLTLEGVELPAPVVAPGGGLYVEIGWSARQRSEGFRALLVLRAGATVLVRELPPAYDWVPAARWRAGEVMVGRHTLSLPEDLPVGRYDLAIAVLGEADGQPWPGVALDPTPTDGGEGAAALLAGELRWEGLVEVRPRAEVEELATVGLGQAVRRARAGDCAGAQERWSAARRHLPPDDPWQRRAAPAHARELARCWAAEAERTGDAALVGRARQHDHRDPEVRRVARQIADRSEAAGDAAMAAGDADGAWRGWSDTLVADPARAWVRRRVEALRVHRLGLKELDR